APYIHPDIARGLETRGDRVGHHRHAGADLGGLLAAVYLVEEAPGVDQAEEEEQEHRQNKRKFRRAGASPASAEPAMERQRPHMPIPAASCRALSVKVESITPSPPNKER